MAVSACKELRRDMLEGPVDLPAPEGGFSAAIESAWGEARSRMEDPMLVSWYDSERQQWSPPVECCGEDEPAWLIYAKSRGADLAISVDSERYVFMFRDFGDE